MPCNLAKSKKKIEVNRSFAFYYQLEDTIYVIFINTKKVVMIGGEIHSKILVNALRFSCYIHPQKECKKLKTYPSSYNFID